MAPRETENSAYAKFLSDKQRAFWYVMVFSGVVNNNWLPREQLAGKCWLLDVMWPPVTNECALFSGKKIPDP